MKRTRREVLMNWTVAGTGLLTGLGTLAAPSRATAFGVGVQLGVVEFVNESRFDLDVLLGEELDGRLYTDLSRLSSQDLVTPLEDFYVRTRASPLLPPADSWQVRVDGLAEKPTALRAESLRRNALDLGTHLMECSGNTRATRFGLLSVTRWAGVPLTKLLESVRPQKRATSVLVSGFDEYTRPSLNSVPGASWIFRLADLASTAAFLATQMGGQPLAVDHGAPVRLMVPGWYGCVCIKWVDRITLTDDAAEATSQMREFASRTQQDGVPQLAREYRPAAIEPAAMPIRIEKWSIAGKIQYRVVGICWGGRRPLNSLQIRFNPEEDYVPVGHFQQARNDPWTVWTHDWAPRSPGTYLIRLTTTDAVQARRLFSGYYVREVEITEV